jgi:hypothetical protein
MSCLNPELLPADRMLERIESAIEKGSFSPAFNEALNWLVYASSAIVGVYGNPSYHDFYERHKKAYSTSSHLFRTDAVEEFNKAKQKVEMAEKVKSCLLKLKEADKLPDSLQPVLEWLENTTKTDHKWRELCSKLLEKVPEVVEA